MNLFNSSHAGVRSFSSIFKSAALSIVLTSSVFLGGKLWLEQTPSPFRTIAIQGFNPLWVTSLTIQPEEKEFLEIAPVIETAPIVKPKKIVRRLRAPVKTSEPKVTPRVVGQSDSKVDDQKVMRSVFLKLRSNFFLATQIREFKPERQIATISPLSTQRVVTAKQSVIKKPVKHATPVIVKAVNPPDLLVNLDSKDKTRIEHALNDADKILHIAQSQLPRPQQQGPVEHRYGVGAIFEREQKVNRILETPDTNPPPSTVSEVIETSSETLNALPIVDTQPDSDTLAWSQSDTEQALTTQPVDIQPSAKIPELKSNELQPLTKQPSPNIIVQIPVRRLQTRTTAPALPVFHPIEVAQDRPAPKPEPKAPIHEEPKRETPAPETASTSYNDSNVGSKTFMLPKGHTVVEAFQWKQEIPDYEQRIYALQGPSKGTDSDQTQWIMIREETHWPTLALGSKDQAWFPLISKNSVPFLARFANTEQSLSMGIVFGILKNGYRISVRGRADQPIVLNLNNQKSEFEKNEAEGVKFFAFTNVEPGLREIFIDSVDGKSTSTIAIPVSSSVSTFVQLTEEKKITISGRVVDVESPDAEGIEGISIRATTSASVEAISKEMGYFQLPAIKVFGNYPTYLELNSGQGGFTHQYQVPLTRTQDLNLYYFRTEQIIEWRSMLAGGFSPQTGIIVGAFPDLMARNPNDRFFYADLQTLASDDSVKPEIYSISDSGQLTVKEPLSVEAPRILGVQVPEGFGKVSIQNDNREVVWSEIIPIRADVIHVIGVQ